MKQLLLLLTLTLAGMAQAQQAPHETFKEISADLPDETEETDLLDKGEFQVEAAFLHTQFASGSNPSVAQAVIRYGLLSRLELRLLVEDGFARDRYLEETVQSTYPLALSTKVSLLKEHPVLPDITLVAYLKLPFTSHTSEQNLYWSPAVSLAFQNKFKDKWKLKYNAGIQQEAFSKDWVEFFNASLHYKVSQRLEPFLEYYGQYQSGEDPQHNAGLGLFYQLSNALGIYAVGGSSIDYEPGNWFGSIGIVYRK